MRNKYVVTLDFSDFIVTLENVTIKIIGKVKVKFNKKKFVGMTRKQISSLRSSVYADMMKYIVADYKDIEMLKKNLIFELSSKTEYDLNYDRKYMILSVDIKDVYDVKKRERKLKLEKINKIS